MTSPLHSSEPQPSEALKTSGVPAEPLPVDRIFAFGRYALYLHSLLLATWGIAALLGIHTFTATPATILTDQVLSVGGIPQAVWGLSCLLLLVIGSSSARLALIALGFLGLGSQMLFFHEDTRHALIGLAQHAAKALPLAIQ